MAKATRHTLSTQSMLLQKVTLSRPGLVLVLVTRSCLTFCNPIYYSPPGLSAHGILQARIPEGAAMPSSRGSSQPRDQICGSCFAGWFFTTEPRGKPTSPVVLPQTAEPPKNFSTKVIFFSFSGSQSRGCPNQPYFVIEKVIRLLCFLQLENMCSPVTIT